MHIVEDLGLVLEVPRVVDFQNMSWHLKNFDCDHTNLGVEFKL